MIFFIIIFPRFPREKGKGREGRAARAKEMELKRRGSGFQGWGWARKMGISSYSRGKTGGKSDFKVKVALLGSIGDGRGSAELSWPLPVLQLINKTDGLFLKKKKTWRGREESGKRLDPPRSRGGRKKVGENENKD